QRENWWLWLEHEGHIWLTQRPETGVWAGLWTLPLLEDEAAVSRVVSALGAVQIEVQPAIKHVLTHLDWHLHPRRVMLAVRPDPVVLPGVDGALPQGGEAHGRWVPIGQLTAWGLPAPLRRLLP
ncbi:MAG TPA: NUDIX domain-containing protein, partial [Aquabacterium sp.]|uniref:NUDIX domain-containing protein n=1 Tax=Aquabacterium sp. TaxID=1872578 RepID=UPI002E33C163